MTLKASSAGGPAGLWLGGAGEPAYEAFAGIGRSPSNLKIISAIYSNPGMFAVRGDRPWVPNSSYRQRATLKPPGASRAGRFFCAGPRSFLTGSGAGVSGPFLADDDGLNRPP